MENALIGSQGAPAHSPGPWHVAETDTGHVIVMDPDFDAGYRRIERHIAWEHGLWLGESPAIDRQFREAEANVRLIAAAPRLFTAAQNILLIHAAYQSEAGAGMCQCEACIWLRPIVEELDMPAQEMQR